MKLYFAGAEAFVRKDKGTQGNISNMLKYDCNCLMSYFHLSKIHKKNPTIKKDFGIKKALFIDSGAFSAFSLGKPTDIDKYIKFCKTTDADHYAVLDVIGSAEGTLKNQQYMESKGVKPVPCFHYGEDWKYLDHYCKHYDYVAIGGMVPISTPKLIRWLDVLFSKYPNHNFHGFGLTTNKLVMKYPWFSVDSSSWIMGAKSGQLYDNKIGSKYYKEINEEWKSRIVEKGFTVHDILNIHYKRNEFNILSYLEMQNNHDLQEYKPNQHTLDGFGLKINKPQKTDKMLHIEARDFWIKENYPNTPRELALKLWRHQHDFNI